MFRLLSFLILFASILFHYPLLSQTLPSRDKLSELLDSAKIYFDQHAIEKGLRTAKETEKLAQKLDEKPGVLAAYYYQGNFYLEMGDLTKAEEYFKQTEMLARELKDTLNLIKGLSGQANALTLQGENMRSLMLNFKAKELAKVFDQDIYYGILSNLSVPLVALGQYENVLSNLLEAHDYYKKNHSDRALAIINNNIGELYREQLHDMDLAKKHILHAIKLNLKIGEDFQLAQNYNNLGLIFQSESITDSALFYLHKSKALKEKIGNKRGAAISHFNIGEIFYDSGNYKKAIQNFETTLKISQKFDMQEGYFYAYQGLGKAYLKLNNAVLALSYLEKAKKIADDISNDELKLAIKRAFYEYYKETKNYPLAIKVFESLQAKKDSINHVLQSEGFAELRTVYEKELSEAENKVLKAQQAENEAVIASQQKLVNFYVATALLLVLLLLILFIVLKQRQKMLGIEKEANKKLQQQNKQLEEQQAKLDNLNQMKNKIFSVLGHDLRSPLSSVLTYIQLLELTEGQDEGTLEILGHLKNETHLTLKTLENILTWARLQMEDKTRVNEKINISNLLEEIAQLNLSQAQNKHISLVLESGKGKYLIGDIHQIRSAVTNLVTNALKFSPEHEQIKISFSKEEGYYQIMVSDNGEGINQKVIKNLYKAKERITTPGTKGEKGTGIGLSLVKEFVELNGGHLVFERKEPRGTNAIIRFDNAQIIEADETKKEDYDQNFFLS